MRRDDPGDVRERALICLGFASGCRRSELVALDVGDLSFGDDGLEVTIRRSKTEQEGFGRERASRTAGALAPASCERCATRSTCCCLMRGHSFALSTASVNHAVEA